jgi:plasmid stability protein
MVPKWNHIGGTAMRTITLKNVPEDLYERLKGAAALNRRSINGEVIFCLERAVHPRKVDPEAVLVRARQLREETTGYAISDEEFAAAVEAGRS